MSNQLAYMLQSEKPFDEVVANLEKQVPELKFRVLAIHDIQETLAQKGLQRGPLKIIEVCNATFAHKALQKDEDVALFMPCRYVVYTQGGKTIVKLARPSLISKMIPDAGLEKLASEIEITLKAILDTSI